MGDWLKDAESILNRTSGIQKNTDLNVIYYSEDQLKVVDPSFSLINNIGRSNELLEFDVFRRYYAANSMHHDSWGIFSWKIEQKTGLTFSQIRQITKELAPKHDLIVFSPPFEEELMYPNPWTQGFLAHPGLEDIVLEVFSTLGIKEQFLRKVYSFTETSYCNYFYGSRRFWSDYIKFIEIAVAAIEKKLSPDVYKKLIEGGGNSTFLHNTNSFYPFIIERLSSLYVCLIKDRIKLYKVDLWCGEYETKMSPLNKIMYELKKTLDYVNYGTPQYQHIENIYNILTRIRK